MIKSTLFVLAIATFYLVNSSHTNFESTFPIATNSIVMSCPIDTAVTNYVIASDVTIAATNNIFSSQTILENSNVYYKSGAETILGFATMTGSLSGPSPGFQIYGGSTLTISIENCN